jgi:hypothetical protein
VDVVVEGIRGSGKEMNVGGCSTETAANFEAELEPQSEERLLLFEAMTQDVGTKIRICGPPVCLEKTSSMLHRGQHFLRKLKRFLF